MSVKRETNQGGENEGGEEGEKYLQKKTEEGREEVEQEQGHEGKLFLCKKTQRAFCNVAGGTLSLHNWIREGGGGRGALLPLGVWSSSDRMRKRRSIRNRGKRQRP